MNENNESFLSEIAGSQCADNNFVNEVVEPQNNTLVNEITESQTNNFNIHALPIQKFKEAFTKQRIDTSKKIDEHIKMLGDVKEFVACEIYFHSTRQKLLENVHEYTNLILVLEREKNTRKAQVLNGIVEETSNNFNYKSKEEKLILIDGDSIIVKIQQAIDMFNDQILFLNESKKTIEGIIFNMKYIFEVHKTLKVC